MSNRLMPGTSYVAAGSRGAKATSDPVEATVRATSRLAGYISLALGILAIVYFVVR